VLTSGGGRGTAAGDLLIAGGLLSASLYSVVAKRFANNGDALSLTTWQFTAATAVALAVAGGRWDTQADLSPADGQDRQIHGAHAPGAETLPVAAAEPAC
jgi:drug/metabolite transporter (DMT)-like permease